MTEPREMTTEEVQNRFLDHIWTVLEYWLHEQRQPDMRGKMQGLAFSILAALDGVSGGLPGFIVAPLPHEDDKEYLRSQGKNWFPENHTIEDSVRADIAGNLHDKWYQRRPTQREETSGQ